MRAHSSHMRAHSSHMRAHSSHMRALAILLAALAALVALARAHSFMTIPQGFSPRDCKVGGFTRSNCRGPCDLRYIKSARYNGPSNPAATYRRGQRVRIAYNRNNHNTGGITRLSLVPVSKMMDKKAHDAGAFHYSCWGAKIQIATNAQIRVDRKGYNVAGNDGEKHRFAKAFYVTFATIPTVIPDGDYVLGWTWYGGVGGDVKGNTIQRPGEYGFFGDYWSCSFVRIRGGAKLASAFTPRFINDMPGHLRSPNGCMSANNRLGVCVREPCKGRLGKHRMPAPFANGKTPKPLTPATYAGGRRGGVVRSGSKRSNTSTKRRSRRSRRSRFRRSRKRCPKWRRRRNGKCK